MATLSVQTISRAGLTPAFVAAAGGGDDFPNTGREFVTIKNGGVGSITVTIVTPSVVDGLAVADRTRVIAAGAEADIGPFPVGTYNDSAGKVALTYTGVTSVTLAVRKLG